MMRLHNAVYLLAIIFIFSVMPVRAECPTPTPLPDTLPPLYGAEAEIRERVLRVIVDTHVYHCPQMACVRGDALAVGDKIWIEGLLWGLDEVGELSRWYRIIHNGREGYVPIEHLETRLRRGEFVI